mmetsp:Transcript_2985/g.6891  ORF Transcript_2985/g.6891 Transcript_2985/m.6891 type:complete len:258 (+) Transcript_2985:1363-2136(+)
MNSLLCPKVDSPLQRCLVELGGRNAIHEQATDAICAFIHRDGVTFTVEHVCGAESSGSGANDCDLHACAHGRRLGDDPAVGPAAFDDLLLDIFDGHGAVHETCDAGSFAGSRADVRGPLRSVAGGQEDVEGLAPFAVVSELVEAWDLVAERTSIGFRAAGRSATVHTASGLHSDLGVLTIKGMGKDYFPIVDTLVHRTVFGRITLVVHKTAEVVDGSDLTIATPDEELATGTGGNGVRLHIALVLANDSGASGGDRY